MDGVPVYLHFPSEDSSPEVRLPAVPRAGEIIEWNGPDGYSEWIVTKVTWSAHPDAVGAVGLRLAEFTDHAVVEK